MKLLTCVLLAMAPFLLQAFTPTMGARSTAALSATPSEEALPSLRSTYHTPSRRAWIQESVMGSAFLATLVGNVAPARAASRAPLGDLLYTILRVREATEQESRLIKSGQFKDLQRANVKLAVRYMVENYRLADAMVGASAYLDGSNDRRIAAGEVGQAAVQNLVTILEYFDSGDVQNLKVRTCVCGWLDD
jgi:hypothetical protein